MEDPYSAEDKSRIAYFNYFSHLRNHIKNISFRGEQENFLLRLVRHPLSSAYDISPGRKHKENRYTRAKITLKQLLKLGLIKIIKLGKHGSIKYSLSDEGIFYLLKNTRLPLMMLLQELFKNYRDSEIFRYLVYPYIRSETLCSPKMSPNLIVDVGSYLVSIFQRMDHIIDLFEKGEKEDKVIYSWNYEKLEEYLRSKYHIDSIDLVDPRKYEEEDDDDYQEIRYSDIENHIDVKIKFDKKSNKGSLYIRDKRVKKYWIPLIEDYMEKKVVKRELYLAGYFVAFCSPRTKEFILPLFSNYPIDTTDNDTLEILSSDKDFIESLREVKESIDTAYRRIISYPDFVF
jgi:hypothetical protein